MSKSACGTPIELASNNAVRITRCTCGTLHVTLIASGVTMRMSPEVLRGAASGLQAAVDKLVEKVEITSTGSTSIN